MNQHVRFGPSVRALVYLATIVACLPGSAHGATATIDNSARMDANNLDMFVTNHASYAYDLRMNASGLIYPKGSSKTVVFAAGPWIGAKVGGEIRVAVGEYSQEFTPGPMVGGTFQPDDPRFKSYKIERGDTTGFDYLNWPVEDGAPVDSLGAPALLGDAMIWSVYNDADPSVHTNQAGFTAPLGVEIQQSTFAFNQGGALGNIIFIRYKLLNKGGNQLDSTYFSAWADPDLGSAADDLVGCDTTMSLGYCYNATNSDAQYGATPPCVGWELLRGPIVPTGTPGVNDTLGMTSFNKYINGTDPTSYAETYNYMRGLNRNGTPVHLLNDPGLAITKFQVSGLYPESANGPTNWLDSNPEDRRLMLSSGPFTMAPGDTQEVFVAVIVGQGTDRLSSIADMKSKAATARVVCLGGFEPSEPSTAVAATVLESVAEPDRVRLVWLVPQAETLIATVFRREEQGDWIRLGSATPEGASRLRFEDATVSAGVRYAYRLQLRESSGEESTIELWVDVPGEAVPAAPSLRFAAANPSGGRVEIRYGLSAAGPARIEVYDVGGRRIATLGDVAPTAGWHSAVWSGRDDRGQSVASGVYFLRLESRGGTAVRKMVVAR